MKKVIVLILFAFSISFVNAQKPEETTALEKLNLKPVESVFDEQAGKIDRETRALRVNRNEHFKSEVNEASEIALSYLKEKRDTYGLSKNSEDFKIEKIIESPSGKYVYCTQYVNDIPVFATNFTIYISKENMVTYALNEFRNVAKYNEIRSNPSILNSNALRIAYEYLNIKGDIIGEPKTELVYFESMDKGLELAWKININSMNPMGDWQVFISASDGYIIHAEDISISVDGSGRVFRPNPLVSANVPYGGNYVHNGGATNPYLESQLVQITLRDLTYENGLYKLKGPYCEVTEKESPTGHTIPELANPNNFNFTRNQGEFGAVMCYYYVDFAARRILQLGYNIPSGLQNFEIDPHGFFGQRNAHYVAGSNYIAMGSDFPSFTFVPSCEDADVILHEYGHAMQYNLGSGNVSTSLENESVKEGSSDYWATSYKRHLYPNNWTELGLWFGEGVSARRVDLNWVYPTNYSSTAPAHTNGQIWSSALMKIWGDLGRDITDKLFLETHLIWGQSPALRDAATAFMLADLNLYKGSHLCQIFTRFQNHGLIDSTNGFIMTTNLSNQTVTTNRTVFSCSDIHVQNVTVTNNAKLTFIATGEIIIDDEINIDTGSEVEIL